MKKLSIEEKAKAYDKAFERAECIYNEIAIPSATTKGICTYIFPELKESEDEKIRKELITHCRNTRCVTEEGAERIVKWISWLEKQGNLMKALQISNAEIGELIEKNYYLKEQLEKQSEHTNFFNKIQIGDKVTRNEDGVLVNLSQLNRVAKKDEKQGENNMGISETTKKELEDNLNNALEKETPESCNEFLDEQGSKKENLKERNICDTCEDSNGCLIHCCAKLLEKQGEQKMKNPEESLGVDSDTYNKIVDECIYGKQKPAEWHREDEQNLNACFGYIQDEFLRRWLTDIIHVKYDEPADLPKGEDYGIDGLYAAIDILQKTLGEVDGYQTDDGILTHKCAISAVKELSKQKPAWGEEDIELLDNTIKFIEDRVAATSPSLRTYSPTLTGKEIPFLKALKDRVQPKQEWKQENTGDLTDFENAMMCVGNSFFGQYAGLDPNDTNAIKEQANLLLELVPKQGYTWKPSDEQMKALYDSIKHNLHLHPILELLYNDLKKLKEE